MNIKQKIYLATKSIIDNEIYGHVNFILKGHIFKTQESDDYYFLVGSY